MRTSAYLRSKYAPAAGDPLGFTETVGKTLLDLPSPRLPCPVERARDVCVFASQIRTGFRRHVPVRGSGDNVG